MYGEFCVDVSVVYDVVEVKLTKAFGAQCHRTARGGLVRSPHSELVRSLTDADDLACRAQLNESPNVVRVFIGAESDV